MKKIAIIPARSGSKGLRDKNILNICGKPLIAYSIEAAIEADLFEKIIVSTDSKKYGEISEKYGAEVMYRGKDLSNDNATTYMVVEDLINKFNFSFDYFVLLQPTSPMRNSIHIREAIEKFERNYNNYNFLVSVKEADCGSMLVKPIESDESLKYFDADFSCYRRQLNKEYSPNGAIFIGKPAEYLAHKHFFGPKSLSYIMSYYDSIDIDNELDYQLACICMDKRLRGEQK